MASTSLQRVGILTGGGDCPGLNAVIRAVAKPAMNEHGATVLGIEDGFEGLVEGRMRELSNADVSGIINLGGTVLGTSNKGDPWHYPDEMANGKIEIVDASSRALRNYKRWGLDALIAIGGDGTMQICNKLSQHGLNVVGVPKTIDNDLSATDVTFGYDSALAVATEAIDRLHTTASSHHRVMVIEVMGRYAGWIALNAGASGTADAILIPEIPYDLSKVAAKIEDRARRGLNFSIVVVAEGARPKDGTVSVISKELGRAERLGGIGEKVAAELQELTGKEARAVVLGHLLRGGTPTTFDRLLSLRFGAAAVRALAEGQSGVMVALDPPTVRYVPLELVAGRMKSVPLDCDTMLTARELGISFGD